MTNKKPAKPKPFVYTLDFTPEARTALHLATLDGLRDALLGLCIKLGITERRFGKTAIKDKLPGQPEGLGPADIDGAHNRLKFEDSSTWSIKQTLEAVLGEENVAAYLREKVSIGQPQLPRFFFFEAADQRVLGSHPVETLESLHKPAGEPVRGIVVEAPTKELASQVVAQPQSRKKFNWCEDVPLDRDGKLSDIRWHQHWLTPLEQLLLKEQLGLERVVKLRRARRETLIASIEG